MSVYPKKVKEILKKINKQIKVDILELTLFKCLLRLCINSRRVAV